MSIKRSRPQIIEGIGRVRYGNQIIENVSYKLAIYREFQEGLTHSGPCTIEMGGSIEGGIVADRGTLFDLSLQSQLTLELKDGFKLNFFLESSASGRIVASGPIYRDDEPKG